MSWTAFSLPAAAASRRDRLRRERTAAQLRRHARLEAEVVEQLEPLLGPAGRPVGETSMALWRRRQVDSYLALPPWRRAWRTWTSWGRVQRVLVALMAATLWTVVCLPLRMLGLASLEVSQIGVAVLAGAAPLAAFIPLRRHGRLGDPLPPTNRPPWRGSRASVTALRLLLGVGALALGVAAIFAVLGPGPQVPPQGRTTPAARVAGVVVATEAVTAACGIAPARVEPAGERRWSAVLPDGSRATVAIAPGVGFADAAGRARVVDGPPACLTP